MNAQVHGFKESNGEGDFVNFKGTLWSMLCRLRTLIIVEKYASHSHLQGNQEELYGKTPKPRETEVYQSKLNIFH